MEAGETIALIKALGGSGGGVLVVNVVYDEEKGAEYTDKTWKEIHDAPMAVIVQDVSTTTKGISPVLLVDHNSSEYSVITCSIFVPTGEITSTKLVTDSENGYLTWAE